jgi:hypothetical protein
MYQPKRMTITRFVCGAVLLMAALAQAQPNAAPALVRVTVNDPYGRFVTGLEQGSFRVLEDGVEQRVVRFSDAEGTASVDVGTGMVQVELHNQYLIGYNPSSQARAGGPHTIEIRVQSVGLPPLQTRLLTVYYPR